MSVNGRFCRALQGKIPDERAPKPLELKVKVVAMAWGEKTRNGRWIGRYRDAAGKVRSVSPPQKLKKDAIRLARDEEHKIVHGGWINPDDAAAITLGQYFVDHWLPNRRLESSTRAGYESCWNAGIKNVWADVPLQQITEGAVQRWVNQMENEGASARQIRDRFTLLQTTLAARRGVCAKRDRLIERNPCEFIQMPVPVPKADEVDVYTPEEYDALVAALDPWWQPQAIVQADLALRWGEVMGQQVDSLSLGYRTTLVRRTIVELPKAKTGNGTRYLWKEYPKGRKQRRLPVSIESRESLMQLVAERGLRPGDRLFSMPDKNGKPLRTDVWPEGVPVSRSHWEALWERARVKAGLRPLTPHKARASGISWLIAGGADPATVQAFAGHASITTTQKYIGRMDDADERTLAALEATKLRYRKA